MVDTASPPAADARAVQPGAGRLPGRVGRELRRNLPALVSFEILFRVLSAGVYLPLLAWAIGRLVASTGSVAVSNFEIVGFLFSPAGLAALTAFVVVSVALFLAQQAGVLTMIAAPPGARPSAVAALTRTVAVLPALMRIGFLLMVRCALVVVPVVGLMYLTKSLLLGGHDIYFYVSTQPPRFVVAAVIGGILGLAGACALALFLLRWSLAVPILMFEGRGAKECLRESWSRTRGRVGRFARATIGWILLVEVVTMVVGVPVLVLNAGLLSVAWSTSALILVLASLLILELVLAEVSLFASFNGLCVVLATLHVEAGGASPAATAAEPLETARRLPRWALWSVASLLVASVVYTSFSLADQSRFNSRVEITAHRGSSRRTPENTLASIQAAIEDGAHYAEIDVQETRDGEVVLLHDTDLRRVAGISTPIWEIDHADLAQLDAGSWFGPDFSDERVPTLREAIETARGRIGLNIELKVNDHEERLVERVLEIVRAQGFEDQCVLSSLDYAALQESRRLAPDLPVGMIVGAALGDITRYEVDFLAVSTGRVTRGLVDELRARGIGLHVWSVKEPEEMRRFVAAGVDNILTDDPATLAALLREMDSLSLAEQILIAFQYRVAP